MAISRRGFGTWPLPQAHTSLQIQLSTVGVLPSALRRPNGCAARLPESAHSAIATLSAPPTVSRASEWRSLDVGAVAHSSAVEKFSEGGQTIDHENYGTVFSLSQ